MVQGGMKCVKYLLFAFNLIFFLAGLGLIVVGALVMTKFQDYFAVMGSGFNGAAILLIVVGGIVFVIGFFGCCGAYKENYCMVMTFAVLLALVFVLEIAAGIAAYVMRDSVEDYLGVKLRAGLLTYNQTSGGVHQAWNAVQSEFHCCGVGDYTSWTNASQPIPLSCNCTHTQYGCTPSAPGGMSVYRQGCLHAFAAWVKENIYMVGGIGIGLAFVQVFGIIIACCLATTIRKEYQVV